MKISIEKEDLIPVQESVFTLYVFTYVVNKADSARSNAEDMDDAANTLQILKLYKMGTQAVSQI